MPGTIKVHAAPPSATARLDAFYRLYAHDTYRFARMICRNDADAEDIAADVMAIVVTKWKTFEPDNPRAYLRRMVTNAVIDRDRRAKRYERRVHKLGVSDRVDAEVDLVNTRETLSTALETLPPNARAALVLKFYFDASTKEIAATLDMPEGTVTSLVSRALTTLRTQLAEDHSNG